MIKLINEKVWLKNGCEVIENPSVDFESASKNTMAYSVLTSHNTSGDDSKLKIKFDAMASHDITYVGIIQTARASGLTEFPLPYVLTNCHNSLCAVGGTINEDDHLFGLSAAKKYGGIYVPAHQAVIHSYMREMMSGCGKMLLGSDSHTRYGALGTMAIGEGGPELVKQLLCRTYDINRPEVIAIRLSGKPKPGVGPHDVAIALTGAVFKDGFVKNKVMEFVGEGIYDLPIDFRCGIDVMTTETTCLSSIWVTDEKTKEYYKLHNRVGDYKKLAPGEIAAYDGMVDVDLSSIEPMIALPFHPSNAYTIKEFNENAKDILHTCGLDELLPRVDKNGRVHAVQGVIAGCAGGIFDNVCAASDILSNGYVGCDEFSLSVYPASQPAFSELVSNGVISNLLKRGASVRSAFCGPCFGAGDVPPNKGLSLRHTTRNFPNREGSKPGDGQSAFVALMDARSIAASAVNGGVITPAIELEVDYKEYDYHFDPSIYENRCYFGYGKPDKDAELVFGPNITDWPEQPSLKNDILLGVASLITDEVTTTDELIPSGETSSYRSNPEKLSTFALSRKDPKYVARAKAFKNGDLPEKVKNSLLEIGVNPDEVEVASVVYARKPGDGSAREQAASCQRVLGGLANIATEYATKRYRSNLINWGMLPFTYQSKELPFEVGDYILVRGVLDALRNDRYELEAYALTSCGKQKPFTLTLSQMTDDEKKIIKEGCLINYYRSEKK